MATLSLGKIFIVFVIALTKSNAKQLGSCPAVRPQFNFNPANFNGTWYEYSKYPIVTESLRKCIRLNVGELSNARVSVERTLTGVLSQTQIGFTGTAALSGPGVLELNSDGRPGILGNTNISILGTDYENYTVAFICEELLGIGLVHQQYAFVLTRERFPSQEVIRRAETALRSNGLSVNKLVQTDQLRCPVNH